MPLSSPKLLQETENWIKIVMNEIEISPPGKDLAHTWMESGPCWCIAASLTGMEHSTELLSPLPGAAP